MSVFQVNNEGQASFGINKKLSKCPCGGDGVISFKTKHSSISIGGFKVTCNRCTEYSAYVKIEMRNNGLGFDKPKARAQVIELWNSIDAKE